MAYGPYEGALRDLIHLLKYQGVKTAVTPLARLMAQALNGVPLPDRLLVVPAPMFKGKLRARGFNQAEELARSLLRESSGLRSAADIQLEVKALIRVRATASQTGLTRRQRRDNVHGAFAVVREGRIRERNILLVDDVMTTGTTAAECARVLLRAGARQVLVATVARALREVPVMTQIMHEEETGWLERAPHEGAALTEGLPA